MFSRSVGCACDVRLQAQDLEADMAGQTVGVKGLLKEAISFLTRLIKDDEKSADAASGCIVLYCNGQRCASARAVVLLC